MHVPEFLAAHRTSMNNLEMLLIPPHFLFSFSLLLLTCLLKNIKRQTLSVFFQLTGDFFRREFLHVPHHIVVDNL